MNWLLAEQIYLWSPNIIEQDKHYIRTSFRRFNLTDGREMGIRIFGIVGGQAVLDLVGDRQNSPGLLIELISHRFSPKSSGCTAISF
jgi:hypothetical protein